MIQTIKTEGGEELIVLTRRQFDEMQGASEDRVVISKRDYTRLKARAGEAEAEDEMANEIARAARARRAREGDTALPGWLSAAILAGDHPIRAARRRAGLSQMELSAKSGIGQGHLSDVEGGKKGLSGAALARVAAELGIEPAWIED